MYPHNRLNDGVCIVGLPRAARSTSSQPAQSHVGGTAVWFDKGSAPLEHEIVCGCCGSAAKMVLVAQLYAPVDFDRCLYVFGCNTRRCSLSAKGWVVVRNQARGDSLLRPPSPPPFPAVMAPMPKSNSAWDDFSYDDTAADCSLDDLNQLLQIRDVKLTEQTEASKPLPASKAAKTEATEYATAESLPYWEIVDEEECWTTADDVAAWEGQVEGQDAGQSEHIARLLKSYYEGEEDAEVVNLVKRHEKGGMRVEEEAPEENEFTLSSAGPPLKTTVATGVEGSDSEEEESREANLSRSSRRQRVEAYFQHRVSYYPTQVLRYAYGAVPLWITYPSPLDAMLAAAESSGERVSNGEPREAVPGRNEGRDEAEGFTQSVNRKAGKQSASKSGAKQLSAREDRHHPGSALNVIPRCEGCGKERVFECQLMPGLLSCIGSASITAGACREAGVRAGLGASTADMVTTPSAQDLERFQASLGDGLDFGVVAIFSCPDSCRWNVHAQSGGGRFASEVAVVQGPPDIA